MSLKSAGIGTFKGLCPFHDERTPSFNVRPQVGSYHCFGCGESGDVYSFVMAMEHTGFVETVERLAARIGYTLHYEGGNPGERYEAGMRRRLLDAHKIAAEFFERNLYSRTRRRRSASWAPAASIPPRPATSAWATRPAVGTTCSSTFAPRASLTRS